MARTAVHLDDLDRSIIEIMRRDPRTSNKEIALRTKVSETTVANRIRSLTERKAMKIMLQRDLHALGYNVLAYIDVFVEGRPTADVVAELVELDCVAGLCVIMGAPQIWVHVYARNDRELLKFLSGELANIRGIAKIETSIALEVYKYNSEMGKLWTRATQSTS